MSSSFTGNPNDFLPESFIIPEDEEEKDIKIRQYLNDIASATNTKSSGLFDGVESITGNRFLPTFSDDTASNVNYRTVFRKVIDFGPLPNNGLKNVAHGITTEATFSLVHLYGAATNPGASTWTAALPLPTSSPVLAFNIDISIDATNVGILTGSDRSAYTRTFVVIEWITTI